MDLARTGFTTPPVGTASYKVETDASGNLVTESSGTVAAGYKRISFNNVKVDATSDGVGRVFTVFLKTLPGENYQVTPQIEDGTFTVKWARG